MPPATTASQPVLPAEVLAFAAEHGVADYLPALLEMTRRIFPTAPIKTQVVEDAETPEDRYIVFEVDVDGLDVDRMVATQHEWSGGLFVHCPPTHAHLFCLRMI